jgi:hypothetical protein
MAQRGKTKQGVFLPAAGQRRKKRKSLPSSVSDQLSDFSIPPQVPKFGTRHVESGNSLFLDLCGLVPGRSFLFHA